MPIGPDRIGSPFNTGPGTPDDTSGPPESWEAPRERWLSTAIRPAFGPRSLLLEVITRLLIPIILLLSVFLLVSGHNQPGGGFAGGLVASMAYVLRYVAGGRHELRAGLPIRPNRLLALGMLAGCAAAIMPLLLGQPVLETSAWEFTLPVFGEVKILSALFFETGVFLIVMGLVLSVVAALGARMEAEEEEARTEREQRAAGMGIRAAWAATPTPREPPGPERSDQ